MDFEQFVLAHEPAIRLGFFLGVFALVGLWETVAPRRALTVSKALRWAGNLGVVMLHSLVFGSTGSAGSAAPAMHEGPAWWQQALAFERADVFPHFWRLLLTRVGQ